MPPLGAAPTQLAVKTDHVIDMGAQRTPELFMRVTASARARLLPRQLEMPVTGQAIGRPAAVPLRSTPAEGAAAL